MECYDKRKAIQKRGKRFADVVTAHGIRQIVHSKHPCIKLFWFVVTVISFVGFVLMTIQRKSDFEESKITYTTNTEFSKDGVELPSVSICQEGFNTEFAIEDIVLQYKEKLEKLMRNPEDVFSFLYEKNFWIVDYTDYNDLHKNTNSFDTERSITVEIHQSFDWCCFEVCSKIESQMFIFVDFDRSFYQSKIKIT